MVDITISKNETVELDTIIKESDLASNPVDYDNSGTNLSDKFNVSGIQTHTTILNPKEVGTHDININGQILTIKVEKTSAIPDTVVSRPTDTTSGTSSSDLGVRITTDVEWPSIGGRLSSLTGSGLTTAYIYRVGDGTLLGTTDISSLTAGDAFVVDNVDLQPYDGTLSTTYNFVADAGGASYQYGYEASKTWPHTSSDGDITIINGAVGATSPSSGVDSNANYNIVDVGNVGFN